MMAHWTCLKRHRRERTSTVDMPDNLKSKNAYETVVSGDIDASWLMEFGELDETNGRRVQGYFPLWEYGNHESTIANALGTHS